VSNKLISPGGERRIPNNYESFKHLSNSCVMVRLRHILPFVQRDFRILDLGCGVGWQTKYLSLYCAHIVGLDVNSEAIEYAKNCNGAANISWVVHTMSALENFNSSEFDLAVSTAAIEHITQDQMVNLFKDLHHVLKPQAYFAGTTTSFKSTSKVNATKWHLFEPNVQDFIDIAKPYFTGVTFKNFEINTPDLVKKVTEGFYLFRNNQL